jgi:phosphopantothenoylcysteine decarboxylase/phosphopantothenate--cysteine ligase
VTNVRSAAEMHAAVMQSLPSADIVVMAAAVADYSPRRQVGKIEKGDGPLIVELVRTPDILADIGRMRSGSRSPVVIGFAAESGDPVRRGREKLVRKNADMIVANDISHADAGFDADTNAVTLITRDGDEPIGLTSKAQVAAAILDRAQAMLAQSLAS